MLFLTRETRLSTKETLNHSITKLADPIPLILLAADMMDRVP